ncbi:MAG: hypothetical protein R3F49_15825 [Planctomycetota bacterium]
MCCSTAASDGGRVVAALQRGADGALLLGAALDGSIQAAVTVEEPALEAAASGEGAFM